MLREIKLISLNGLVKINNIFYMMSKITYYISEKNIKIVLSNSDVELVRENFKEKYNIKSIICKRSINSKTPDAKVKELIITMQ